MRIRNKSLTKEAIIAGLGNFKVPANTTVNAPVFFEEEDIVEAIKPHRELTLLDGFFVTQEDLTNSTLVGQEGVMTKEVYDTNLNNIVDTSEGGGGGASSLEITFSHTDFASLSKNIGTSIASANVQEIRLIITSPFDSGSITVGDDLDSDRLMISSDSDLGFAATFISQPDHDYSVDTMLKVYFSGSPSTGEARLVVFLG